MKKRMRSETTNRPYFYDHIKVYYEFRTTKFTIIPGQKIKFKHERGIFKFRQFVYNESIDISWIDCMDINTGEFRSFAPEKFKGIHTEKKSRKKKQVV